MNRQEYPVGSPILREGILHNPKLRRGMYNLVGITSIVIYCYTTVYNWIVLNVVPTETKDLIFWVVGILYICVKLFGYALRATDQRRRQRHEADMDKIDLEMKKMDAELKRRSLARGEDYDKDKIV